MGSIWGMCAAPALIALLCGSGGIAAAQAPEPKVLPIPLADVENNPTWEQTAAFHDYSWRSFIALNWPAAAGAAKRGQPDEARTFGDAAGPRVWMTWKSRYEMFQPGGAEPKGWASYEADNPCGAGFANDVVTLKSFRPFADFNQPTTLGGAGNPLVARNRTYVRYEVRVNQPLFNSIVDKKWYLAGNLPTRHSAGRFNLGSTAIKAAWRILTERDTPEIRARYYVVPKAQVYDVRSRECKTTDIALVGLHIVSKTPGRPQWVWSSFEHVDNVPGRTTEPTPPAGVPYSFHDPNEPPTLSPEQPPPAISEANKPVVDPVPMQVLRMQEIAPQAMAANRAYWGHDKIKGTIWENYMLVMTQWPTSVSPESPGNDANPSPSVTVALSNTTMETYFQADGLSCMKCHQHANYEGRDFIMFTATDAFRSSGPMLAGAQDESLSADPVVKSVIEFVNSKQRK